MAKPKPYINRLQDEVNELKRDKAEALLGVTDLLAYLSSRKFRSGDPLDNYVSTGDVTNWLQAHVIRHLLPTSIRGHRT